MDHVFSDLHGKEIQGERFYAKVLHIGTYAGGTAFFLHKESNEQEFFYLDPGLLKPGLDHAFQLGLNSLVTGRRVYVTLNNNLITAISLLQ